MTKELSFDTIDIFADPLDLDARERRLIHRECDKAGLPIISIACVAVGLIDFNPSVQRFHLDRCRRYLDLAYEYDAKNMLLVIGEYIWERQVIAPAEQWQTGALGEIGLAIEGSFRISKPFDPVYTPCYDEPLHPRQREL